MGSSIGLTSSFTLRDFWELIFSRLGPSSIVIAIIAFIGLIAYMSSLPVNKTFTTRDSRITGLGLLNYFMYFLSAPILFWMLIYRFFQFSGFFVAFIIPLLLIALNFRWLSKRWNYCDLIVYHRPHKFKEFLNDLDKRRHIGTPILIIVFLTEITLLYFFNPIFSVVGWLLLIYVFTINLLNIALSYGIGLGFKRAPYLKFSLNNGESFAGFLITKDLDNCFIVTRNWSKAIFTNRFLEMEVIEITNKEVEDCKKQPANQGEISEQNNIQAKDETSIANDATDSK